MLDRYLGVALDVRMTMTAKILKSNCEIVYQSTYCGLNDNDNDNELKILAHIALCEEFDKNIEQKWGANCILEKFPDVAMEDTPLYNKFNDVKNIDLQHQD